MDGSSTGRAKFLSIHTYSCSCICHGYCFLLFSASTSHLPHSTRFLILHKGVPTANSRKRKPWAKLGRNQFPAGGMKTVMKQQGPASTTSTPRMTCHVHSPSPAALLSLPQEQAQAKTLTDLKHFSSSSNKALYPDPLPPQEEGWTPSTGQQAHADRAFSVILASYSQSLAETADCTTMKPSLLD